MAEVFETLWSIEFAALVHISDIYWSLVQLHLETLTLETPKTKWCVSRKLLKESTPLGQWCCFCGVI